MRLDTGDDPHFLTLSRDGDATGSRAADVLQETVGPVVDETNINRVGEDVDEEASLNKNLF